MTNWLILKPANRNGGILGINKSLWLLFWLPIVALCAPGQWTWQNPLPQGNGLRELQFFNADTGVVAGDGGTFLKTENAGTTWSLSRVPAGGLIFSMAFKDAQTGLILEDGLNKDSIPKYGLYRTEDGGKSWKQVRAMETNRYGTLQWPGGNTVYLIDDSILRVSGNGGLDWSPCASFSYNFEYIFTSFLDADRGYFIGPGDSAKSSRKLYRTYDRCGHLDSRPLPDSTEYHLLHFQDPRNGLAFGTNASGLVLFRTQDSGNTWINVKPQVGQKWVFQSIQFTDSVTGFGFGGDGSVQKTRDGGATWTSVYAGGDSLLLWAAAFPTERVAYRVGDFGIIEKSTDGSVTWQKVSHGDLVRSLAILQDIDFINEQIGCGVGSIQRKNPSRNDAFIIRTIDGGIHWDTLSQNVPRLHSIRFRDASLGIAVGDSGTLLRTTDRGATWEPSNRLTADNLISVRFGDGQDVFACTQSNSIFRSQDDGKSWQPVYADTGLNLYSMDFHGSRLGVVAGTRDRNAVILRTTDGGTHWKTIPLGLHEMSTVNSPTCVHIGPTGTLYAADYEDIVYRSIDSGNTWDSLARFAQFDIKSILFLDSDTGFIAGTLGIYMTTNGGKTWNPQPIPAGEASYLEAMAFPKGGSGYAIGITGDILRYDRGTTRIQKLADAPSMPKLILEDGRLRYYLNSRATITAAFFRMDGTVVSRLQGRVEEPGDHSILLPAHAGSQPLLMDLNIGNLRQTQLLPYAR